MKYKISLIALCFSLNFIYSQQQITDFNSSEGDKSSDPSGFIEFNNLLFFNATTASFGREIWVTTGNTDEAYLLKDINQGKENGINGALSNVSVKLNGELYFIAADEFSQGEILKTDGTSANTTKVTDFIGTPISKLTLVGNKFYFLIKKDDNLNLWISDGTSGGTQLVKGNMPIWNSVTFQEKLDNLFVFTFQANGSNDSKVWRSDGTETGTFPLTEGIDGNGSGIGGTSALSQYVEHDNILYFVSRQYLYKTDGTLANTSQVTSLHNAQIDLINYSDAIEINGNLYFQFYQHDDKRLFIWEYNPNTDIATKIYDSSSTQTFGVANFIDYQNDLFFIGPNPSGGTSLLKIDLNDYSEVDIKEFDDGTTIPNPSIFTSFNAGTLQKINNQKLFCAIPYFSLTKRKGWISEYTSATTINIPNLDDVYSVFDYNNLVFYPKEATNMGRELWKSDGTNDGSFLVDNINKSKNGLKLNDIIDSVTLDDKLIFVADDAANGREHWVYDNNNLSLLKDINPGSQSSASFDSFIIFKNELYFVARMNTDITLWKTDGTTEGTTETITFEPSDNILSVSNLMAINGNYLYFFPFNSSWEYKLYRTDGTSKEFLFELGVNSNNLTLSPEEIQTSGNYIYYTALGNLWALDTTNGEVNKMKDFFNCTQLTDVNGKLYFVATDESGEEELWSSSGTTATTEMVRDIGIGYSSEPDHLISFNNTLYYTTYTATHGREIWRSVDNVIGVAQLIDINMSKDSSIKNPSFCVLNNELFFAARDGINGTELWKTNGDINNATLVKDINVGFYSSSPAELTKVNNLIYFQAFDEDNGIELWKTNGTSEGTILDTDLATGASNSCPSNILSTGNDIFFAAEKTSTGRQFWKIQYDSGLSLEEFTNPSKIAMFPNPTNDFIYIQSNTSVNKVDIYDLAGRLIDRKSLKDNKLNLSNFQSGFYLITLTVDNRLITKKIIKED